MTLEELRVSNWIVMECISGSKAYGLDTPESDTDIKGVFVLPKHEFYGLDYLEQVSNPSNDIVFYELKRFVELLAKNNPNILELLATPDDSVIIKHSLLAELKPDLFLSRLCLQSFGNYAMAQIRKAR
ncbi:MAG TPA: nucleotidyltransferase, partial [Cryomorphaceae bacterium]|nr:nucleotidyltransferase [Cryomorphaceae bacterium]